MRDLPTPSKGSLLAEELVFVPICGGESRLKGRASHYTLRNNLEADAVCLLVGKLLEEGVPGSKITIITNYTGQKNQILEQSLVNKNGVAVQTVDSSQVISMSL